MTVSYKHKAGRWIHRRSSERIVPAELPLLGHYVLPGICHWCDFTHKTSLFRVISFPMSSAIRAWQSTLKKHFSPESSTPIQNPFPFYTVSTSSHLLSTCSRGFEQRRQVRKEFFSQSLAKKSRRSVETKQHPKLCLRELGEAFANSLL